MTETPPPVPDGPDQCDTFEMAIVHAAFLNGYQDAAALVRGVAAGDTGRAAYIGRYLSDADASLHVHHHSEDIELWDRLEQRAPACALHVQLMRSQHAKVAEQLAAIDPLREAWRTTADVATGERLAVAYEEMLATLQVHMNREVAEIVPVAAKVMTQREWESLAKHSMRAIPPSRLLIQLGILLAPQDLANRRRFMKLAPAPIRVLYGLVGRRQYERQHRTLFPGRPVPATGF